MLQIIVEHTHLVTWISQCAHNATNNGRVHTSTYTPIKSICTYHLGKPGEKNDCKVSLGRRLREQIQHFFFFISFSIYLLQYSDLAQSELRSLCEIVGTSSSVWNEGLVRACRDTKLDVWVSINTPINQSPTKLSVHCKNTWVNGIMENTPPVHAKLT